MTHADRLSASPPWALYGATGVTGRFVLDAALASGLRPTLVGRNLERLKALAEPRGLRCSHAPLDRPDALDAALAGHAVVVNVAGPFSRTTAPLVDAALRGALDYIDLSGELGSLRALLDRNGAAASAGSALVGGAGFGIAATDALAVQVSAALGGAEWLRLSVAAASAFASTGVAESTLEVLAGGGFEVEDGKLVHRRLARGRWTERAGDGIIVAFASAPLADLVAARHATQVARIVAGVPMRPVQAIVISIIAPLLPHLMRVPMIRHRLAATGGHAASMEIAKPHRSRAWVTGGRGARSITKTLEGGEGFALAADMAVLALKTHFARRPTPGAHTPATAYGPGWLSTLPGLTVEDADCAGDCGRR